MGFVSRDVSVKHDGHEIALSVNSTGSYFSTERFKLYIDGRLADEHATPALAFLFGPTVTLRAQLPPYPGQSKRRTVKVIAKLRLPRYNYLVFVDDEQIHQERGTFLGA
jgi:hypothetical protein